METERAIGNDWVIRHGGRSLQLQPGRRHGGLPRSKTLVCEWEDGTMEVHYRGEKIGFTELREPRQKSPAPIAPVVRAMVVRKPKPNHPWRQDGEAKVSIERNGHFGAETGRPSGLPLVTDPCVWSLGDQGNLAYPHPQPPVLATPLVGLRTSASP